MIKPFAAFVLAFIVVLGVVAPSHAAVTVTPMAAGVTNQFVNGKWQITITRTPFFQEVYSIEGDAGDNIEYIRVTNNNSSPISEIRLLVRGVPGTPGLSNVEEIDRAGLGLVWVVEFIINGDCGRASGGPTNVLRVNRLQGVDIGGNMYAETYINGLPNGAAVFLRDMRIRGNLRNHIFGDTGPIESIRVDGDIIGPSNFPLIIRSSMGIDSIRANNIINTCIGQYNNFTYQPFVNSLEVAGNFTGGTTGAAEQPLERRG